MLGNTEVRGAEKELMASIVPSACKQGVNSVKKKDTRSPFVSKHCADNTVSSSRLPFLHTQVKLEDESEERKAVSLTFPKSIQTN